MKKTWLEQLNIPKVHRISRVRGGDVNQAFKIVTETKDYFLLVQAGRGEEFYAAEIAGLKALSEAGVRTPEVIRSGVIDGDAFLLLEYLAEGRGNQRDLGRLVAKLHGVQQEDKRFGFELPYQGSSIHFDNQWADSWLEVFVERRLDILRTALVAKRLWGDKELKKYAEVRKHIVMELSCHESDPSLLHGDLWSGNFMFLTDGQPVLFDPSPLYGDREFDIGVSTVFGGFSPGFYAAYQRAYPLAEGFEARLNFYRLYFLMVHLDKFGDDYAASVQHEMDKIIVESRA